MTATDIANKAISYLGGSPLTDLATDLSKQAVAVRRWYSPDSGTPIYSALDECLRSHPWNFATARKRIAVIYTTLTGAAITNAAGVIQVTQTAHGFATGDRIFIKDVQGVTSANGRWFVTVLNADNFTLDESVFGGTYTASTGKMVLIPQFAYGFQISPPADCLRVLSINTHGGQLEDDGTDFLFEGGLILTGCDEINIKYVRRVTTPDAYPADFVNAFALFLASFIAQDVAGNSGRGAELRQMYEQLIASLAKARDGNEGKGRRIPPFEESQMLNSRFGGYGAGYANGYY